MRRIKAIFGYTWAGLAVPIILATFMGMDFWAKNLVAFTGLKVSPWYTGGEVMKVTENEQYRLVLHRPVFDGFFGRRAEGFVQIDFKAKQERLPAEIIESIDIDSDGTADFQMRMDTISNTVTIDSGKGRVRRAGEVIVLGKNRTLRIFLRNMPQTTSCSTKIVAGQARI